MFTLRFDLDGDGTPEADLSAYLKAADALIGIREPMALTAEIGTCHLTLNNADQRFSPDNTDSPYYGRLLPNRTLWLEADNQRLFTGRLRQISVSGGSHGLREAYLIGQDALGLLAEQTPDLPPLENVRSDQLVQRVINNAFEAAPAYYRAEVNRALVDGDWLELDGVRYTFRTLVAAPNQVQLSDVPRSLDALLAAANALSDSGGLYSAGTQALARLRAEIVTENVYYRQILARNPHRYYRLGDSGTQAADSGANRIAAAAVNGALLGTVGALSSDPDGGAAFNGSNQYLESVPLDLRGLSFTVEFWMRPSSSPPTSQVAFCTWNAAGGASDQVTVRLFHDGRLQVVGGAILTTAAGAFSFDVWTRLTVVYDKAFGMLKLYRDGAKIGELPSTGITSNVTHFTLGRAAWGAEAYKGGLDDVSLTLRACTDAEIALSTSARHAIRFTARERGAVGNGIAVSGSDAFTISDFAGSNTPSALDVGRETFEIAADTWRLDRVSALRAIQECVLGEWGAFWADRDGTLTFRNRDYWQRRGLQGLLLSLNGEARALEGCLNPEMRPTRVSVRYTPRRELLSGVVARAERVIKVPGQSGFGAWRGEVIHPQGGKITVILPFLRTEQGQITSAKDLIIPLVAGIDYHASDAPDGLSGFDYTDYGGLRFEVAQRGAALAITVYNAALGPLYVRDLQVRGVGIITAAPIEYQREDTAAQARYGRRSSSVDLPLGTRQSFAESLAAYLLEAPSLHHPLKSVQFANQRVIHGVNLFSVSIGGVVMLGDPQLGASSAPYRVTGLRYQLTASGDQAITWYVRPIGGQNRGQWSVQATWDNAVWGI